MRSTRKAVNRSANRCTFSGVSLDGFPVFRYSVRFVLDRPLEVLPQGRGVLWRGAFGVVFRRLVCHDVELDCIECMLRAACPYPVVFRPEVTLPELPIARLREPPRPFVLVDPLPESSALPARSPLSLGMTVVGSAHRLLPHFAATFKRLGEQGIGRKAVRFRLEAIEALDGSGIPRAEVYRAEQSVIRQSSIGITAADLERPGDHQAKRVLVRFRTPTLLRSEGAAQENPSFGVLFRRVRDRVSALATFFGEKPLDFDARGLGELADTVETRHSSFSRFGWNRTSARTQQRHPIQGVVGEAIYEGDALGELMPWLRLAELLHVGKHATFGNGKVEVQVMRA